MEEKKGKVEYFKVLGEGLKTRDGKYQWKPGQWNEEPAAVKDGEACGIGLHVFIGKPNWNYTRYIPDHTYRVIAVQGKCGSDLEKARFRRVKLALLPMTLKEILGEKKDGMKGANLSWANLSWANLSWANLSRANLSGADLSWANLSGADLSRANLSRANLSRANLSGANLSRADLSGADLSWANLSGADLSGANLSGANLSGANLSGAHFCKDMKELSKEQKKQAHC